MKILMIAIALLASGSAFGACVAGDAKAGEGFKICDAKSGQFRNLTGFEMHDFLITFKDDAQMKAAIAKDGQVPYDDVLLLMSGAGHGDVTFDGSDSTFMAKLAAAYRAQHIQTKPALGAPADGATGSDGP